MRYTAGWEGNESIRDEFRDLHPRNHTAPVVGQHWDSHEQHQIAQLRHSLQIAETNYSDQRRISRELEQELQRLEKAYSQLFEATGWCVPEFQVQGNFTICILVDPFSERVYTGAACCNVKDEFNLEIGKAISLGRAMNSRADFFAERAFAR